MGGGVTRLISTGSTEWCPRLDELGSLPPVARLHARGVPLPARDAVAVVGTRRPTAAGIEAAAAIARGLAEAGFVVVSGLAVGIDAVAHAAALQAGGCTVAVVGCGIDVEYPRRNLRLRQRILKEGTILSEYADGTPPQKAYFPQRNRIIAGLSLGVVVVEGGPTSGALVTARLALDSNRTVFAVPGSVRNAMSEGPNELIRSGRAALVTRVEHIFEELAPGLAWKPSSSAPTGGQAVDDVSRSVLGLLDDAPVAPDRLADHLDLKPGKLLVELAKLEVRGLVGRSRAGYTITQSGAAARRLAPRSG